MISSKLPKCQSIAKRKFDPTVLVDTTSIGDLLDDDDGGDADADGQKKNKYAGLTSGQIKILKQKAHEEKLRRIAAKIAQ